MANLLKLLARHTIFKNNRNLISLNEPYKVIMDLLKHHDVTGIIDAGASNGRISQRLLRFFPNATVYAFEPNPLYKEVWGRLSEADDRLKPQHLALSDSEELVNLNITESPGITSLFTPGKDLAEMYSAESEINSIEEVEAVKIDEWAKRMGNPRIQLMKFDIQGGELRAIKGAVEVLNTSTLVVYTEILFNPLYEGGAIYSKIDLYLRDQGFILYDVFKPRYHSKGKLLWGNAIFVHANRTGF